MKRRKLNQVLRKAVHQTINEILAMPKTKFVAELKKHKNGDVAKFIRFARGDK